MSYGWLDNPASAGAKPATLDGLSMHRMGHIALFPKWTHVCVGFVIIVLILWAIGGFK